MSGLWSYFWPALAAGLVIGFVAGLIAFRRSRPVPIISLGLAASISAAAIWHGPAGAGASFAARVERVAHQTLRDYEMSQIQARLGRDPLTRQLRLSGPADDFQRSELVRLLGDLPGVSRASWSSDDRAMPLIAEGGLTALGGYLLGLLLAYLVALRRRYNAQWEW